MSCKITFQPLGKRCIINENQTVLDIVRKNGIRLTNACGGNGTCGKCKVQVKCKMASSLKNEDYKYMNPITKIEKKFLTKMEITNNYRLACFTKIYEDAVVYIPDQDNEMENIILDRGRNLKIDINSSIKTYDLIIKEPSLEDYRDDKQRLVDAICEVEKNISNLKIDYSLLKNLSSILRKNHWKVNVVVRNNDEIIDVRNILKSRIYGVSIDLGTTTLAASLIDLKNGKLITRKSKMNSQIQYGDDVISRISYCMLNTNGLDELSNIIREDINTLIYQMAKENNIDINDIFEIVIVGNTVMEHIFLKLNPEYIGKAPFVSGIREFIEVKLRQCDIVASKFGYLCFLPIEAGFVGADNVAVLLAEKPYLKNEYSLLIDIGTNGEIVFGNKDKLYSTSCATGPALEGAQLSFGMRATNGAIEKVKINDITLEPTYEVIGKVLPKGICGSGIIDVIAELVRLKIILKDGSFNSNIKSDRLIKVKNKVKEYVLVWKEESGIDRDIVIKQKDIRAVQLAKGALYAGAKLLIKHSKIKRIDKIILAGAFGSYIDKKNALYIGLFPTCPLDKIEVVGNAASEGAKLALLNMTEREEAKNIAKKVEFVEVANEKDFQKEFFEGMNFPYGISIK